MRNDRGFPPIRTLWPLAVSMGILWILRVPQFALEPLGAFLVQAACSFFLTVALKKGCAAWTALLFAVTLPALAWLLDLISGAMTLPYGASCLIMSWVLAGPVKPGPAPRAALAALSAGCASALGVSAILLIQKEMTSGAALYYAFTRQAIPTLAYFSGCLAASLIRKGKLPASGGRS